LIDILSGAFYQPWLLAGLAALLVPPLIHLLNRRRHDVVDWGAMQFLQVGQTTRRRLFLEEVLLMAVRMALVGLLVLAVAGPFLTSTTLARLAPHGNRDVVLIFDGSYSMAASDRGQTAHEAARQWARSLLDERTPGDSVALLQAREQAVPILEPLSRDLVLARKQLDRLPPPSGEIDWRPALRQALALLEHSQRAEREIILLTDGQRHGWADRDSLFRWQLLSGDLASSSAPSRRPPPRLWVVNVVPERTAQLPNWSLESLETTRPLVPVDQEVRFRTAIDLHGRKTYSPPHRIRLEIDGQWVRDLAAPRVAALENGKVPLSFSQRFATPGSHLVTVLLEPDPPPEERPEGYAVRDAVAADNRQDLAIEVVPALPVLLVAGDLPTSTRRNFLRDALAPANDPSPVIQVRLTPAADFGPASLEAPPRPRVLILANVSRLTPTQEQAIQQFLAGGGGVLLTLGDRVDRDAYNERLHRQGKGWLPVQLDAIEGDENEEQKAAHPEPGAAHPALDLFRARGRATPLPQLAQAHFPRWWKLTTRGEGGSSVVVSSLRTPTAVSPFLVEGVEPERAGRVLACAVPLDDSWGSNVVRTGVFVPLLHELVYYLAGTRESFNLHPGQPLRWKLTAGDASAGFTLQSPSAGPRPVVVGGTAKDGIPALLDPQPRGAVLRIEGQRESGVYRLKTPAGQTVYYVVRPRGNEESDLTPCSDEDRQRVAELVPGLTYESRLEPLADSWVSEEHRQDLWWWLLLGLIVLLCAEVWMTRRMVKRQEVA
jgi:hypothetical protein